MHSVFQRRDKKLFPIFCFADGNNHYLFTKTFSDFESPESAVVNVCNQRSWNGSALRFNFTVTMEEILQSCSEISDEGRYFFHYDIVTNGSV